MTRPLSFPQPVVDRLRVGDERVLVTGATGWLGQALLEMLAEALGPAFERRVMCFGSTQRHIRQAGRTLMQRALVDLESLPHRPSILFHFAYLTKEKSEKMSLEDYVERNRSISALVERAAAKVGVDRLFVMSSGAAAQAAAATATVDSVHVYGALKREDEERFERYAAAAPRRTVLAVRLFNLSGPYINKLGSYALSSFIEQARHTGIIRINAAYSVTRSYTGVENLLAVAVSHLLDAQADTWTCMETAGEREVEVGELAECVRALLDLEVAIERPVLLAGREDRYVGDSRRYKAMAARYGVEFHFLDRQIQDTIRYLVRTTP